MVYLSTTDLRDRTAPVRYGWEQASAAIGSSDPKNYSVAIKSVYADEWKNATDSEMNSLMKNDTWELSSLPEGKKVIGCRWVLKTKRDGEGEITKYKARLVAQGFSQTPEIDYDEVFAPVLKYTSLRCLLSVANQFDYEIHQMDVKSAYLNGTINNDLYMKQPEGYVDQEKKCKMLE